MFNIILLCLFSFMKCVISVDYCKLCANNSHTMCKYKKGPAVACIDYKKPVFTPVLKKYILDIHNDIRNHVASGEESRGTLGKQPSASNMFLLQWDDELSEIAQRWADQCILLNDDQQHDLCKKTERFEVGQNVLTAVTTTKELPELAVLVLNWYKQVSSVIPTDVETFSGLRRGKFLIGQYTQLVWAETKFVGCGIATFKNPRPLPKNNSDQYLHRFVCNYGPAGNIMGKNVYQKGPPCSKCPNLKCDKKLVNLCTVIEVHDKETHISHVTQKIRSVLSNTSENYYFNDYNIIKSNALNSSVFRNSYLKMKIIHYFPNDTPVITPSMKSNIVCFIPITDDNVFQINERRKKRNIFSSNTKVASNIMQIKKVNKLESSSNSKFDGSSYGFYNNSVKTRDIIYVNDNEIIFRNKIHFKREKGIWYAGHCRCNFVYRSKGNNAKCTILNIIIFIFYSFLFYI